LLLAWDVGQIVSWSADEVADGKGEGKYVLVSLRGFDFVTPTAHVETVAVFRLAFEHEHKYLTRTCPFAV
jgi:hypothetical protein